MKSKCRQNPISLAVTDPWSQSAGDFKVALNLTEGLRGGVGVREKKEKEKVKGQGYFQMGFCLTSSVKVECFD